MLMPPSPTGHLLSPKLSEKARRGLLLLLLLLGLVVLLGVGPSLLLLVSPLLGLSLPEQ